MDKDLGFLKDLFKIISDFFRSIMEIFRGTGGSEDSTTEADGE